MATTKTRQISAAELQRRAAATEASIHSAALEGQELSPADAADSEAYVRGDLTLEELGQRTRERYGVA